MDAASLVLAVIAVFKDGYLVARFVYNTVNSGLKHAEERTDITQNIRRELLFLRSFGSWFVQARGNVTNDPELNKVWLQEIQGVLENLKLDLAEYRSLAEKDDDLYRKYSPSLNPACRSSGVIEFKLGEEIPPVREPTMLGSLGKMFSKTTIKEIYVSGDWALFRKRKLEKLVTRFEKRNKLLRDILQVAIPAQIQAFGAASNVNDRWLQTDHLDNLGLRGHVQIAQIQQARKFDSSDMEIKNALVTHDSLTSVAITPGRLRMKKAKNNVQDEKVLVEFKQYNPEGDGQNTPTPVDNDSTTKTRQLHRIAKLAALLHASGLHDLGTLPFKDFIDQPDQQSDAKSKALILTRPYLINFEFSRLHYNTTSLDRDEDAEKDLYRHPALQVSERQDSFNCVHHIYALGVVLLEIALWKSAAQIIEENSETEIRHATEVRRFYIKIAKLEVPWLMGDAFLEAILGCLTDEYEDDFIIPDRGTFRKKVIENLSPKALYIKDAA